MIQQQQQQQQQQKRSSWQLFLLFSLCTFIVLLSTYKMQIFVSEGVKEILNLKLFEQEQLEDEEIIAEKQIELDLNMTNNKCPLKNKKSMFIQFIHVPKAGGTSIQEQMKIWGNKANIPIRLHDGDGPYFDLATIDNKLGIYLGHRGYGFSKKINSKKPITIIILREPISRIISTFDYLRTVDLQEQQISSSSLIGLIKKAWKDQTFDSVVTRYSRTRFNDKSSLLPSGSASFSDRTFHRILRSQLQYLCGYECVWLLTNDEREKSFPLYLSEEEEFKRAKHNLIHEIDCVGVLSEIDNVIIQMKQYMDFIPNNFQEFPHENKISNIIEKSHPSPQILALLNDWLEQEIQLYQQAVIISRRKTQIAQQCIIS